MNKFSEVAGYKKNIQNSIVFWYSGNEKNRKEIKKTVLFITASTKKYLEINLTK